MRDEMNWHLVGVFVHLLNRIGEKLAHQSCQVATIPVGFKVLQVINSALVYAMSVRRTATASA